MECYCCGKKTLFLWNDYPFCSVCLEEAEYLELSQETDEPFETIESIKYRRNILPREE